VAGNGVARPVDAAGLVLIRAGDKGPEVLMGRRHRRSTFLPDVYVFPGGRVDPADSRPSGFAEMIPGSIARQLRRGTSRRDPAAFLRAAIRETFEETGLLVARSAGARPVTKPRRAPVWRAFARIGAEPDFAGMDYICRAITPTSSKRRYNTRFFLADGRGARGDLVGNGELEDLDWWPVSEIERLPIVDVTEFVLGEALRRWAQNLAAGSEPAPLFSYRKDAVTLRRHGTTAPAREP
jgi:8-oxo-dGTP pyrophosphatase MutT (NUDIX family)